MNRYAKSTLELPVLWEDAGGPVAVKIGQQRRTIEAAAGRPLDGVSHRIRLALNEAEALAWQTEFPHLVFPLLAEEKLAELRRWESRQHTFRNESLELAFAA